MRRASEPAGVTVAATAARDPRTPVDGLNLTAAGVAGRPGAPGAGDTRRARPAWLERLTSVWFVGPAVLVLLTLVAYPIVYTVWLSLHASDGSTFVGLDNYVRMFTAPETRQAIVNNVVWVAVAPTLVTAIGLVLAVLIERVRLSTVFKAVVFMPMAISFLAAGVTFRMVYDESPDRGVLNAAVVAVHDAFSPPSAYYGARPREGTAPTEVAGAVEIAANTGAPVLLPLVGLPQDRIPAEATAAQTPTATGLSGVVWLDFTPGGGGTTGAVDAAERGLPSVLVQAVRDGTVVAETRTGADGSFSFGELASGAYTVRLAEENFTPPFNGVTWLGPSLVTPSIILAYIWIWAGFAMVLITAGLSAIPRDALEAARVDGATEWQVFRRVTVPLVRPVLVVVIVTLTINVLKIFDLVLVLAPESSQDDANVIALQMYRVSFGGGLDFGLGSALGVLLFLLVLPAMLFNVRRMRKEQR
ncbi:ABC transporter permease subunit [Catellatospora coxensis]|uniref:ABC transporter permease n=1 Tax=Catellatospora coxensis TaxID=310354 RepID=A0A8J3L679_9ACTN|nr:ABC transporter permease subunit [Catellatospora coxensis]GIG09261.1 ABC transporter permease [Catellatospora coxensis]